MPDLNVGTVSLGDHDLEFYKAMAGITDESIRGKTASVISSFVRRYKAEYKANFQFAATKYGLSLKECFWRANRGVSLGAPESDQRVIQLREELLSLPEPYEDLTEESAITKKEASP